MSDKIVVHYVTATHPSSGTPRTDLGKFFARAHADEHAKTLDRSWVDVRIEAREETREQQDPAHRALFDDK
jgi:hypothetical protein